MSGAYLVTAGYISAIIGGAALFVYTPPDVGGTHVLMVPVSDGDGQAEAAGIASRRLWGRIGFGLLTLGCVLQLAGYWVDRLSNA